jgi:hypothetical protein
MAPFSINFTVDIELSNYTRDDLNGICKNLFMNWYDEKHLDLITMNNLDRKIEKGMMPIIDEMNQICKNIYYTGKTNVKGQMFENVVENVITESFKDYSYVNTSSIAHNGDGQLESISGLKCIVEMKNYTTTVNTQQIVKLKYDMKYTGIRYAIMLSANSNIQNKKNLDIEMFIDENIKYYIIYVSHYSNHEYKIQIAITLLEHLHMENRSFNNLKCIESELHLLNGIVDSMSKLKSQFINMEKMMKENFDSFYINLRDTEYNMKNQIQTILSNIKVKINDLDCDTEQVFQSLSKCKECILLKHIYDTQFVKENYGLKMISNDIYLIDINRNKKIALIKFVSKRIDIIFYDPEIKLSITQNNKFLCEMLIRGIIENYNLH